MNQEPNNDGLGLLLIAVLATVIIVGLIYGASVLLINSGDGLGSSLQWGHGK
jgi:hypothetical protein